LVEKFALIRETDSKTLTTVCEAFEASKISNFLDLSEDCLRIFDENADKVLKIIDQLLVRPETLIEIVSRDTFGVKEIDLFNALIDWITKTRVNFGYDWSTKERVLRATRFHLISDQDMENDVKPAVIKLFNGRKIDSILEALINKYSNKSDRVCIQTETFFTDYNSVLFHSSYRLDKTEDSPKQSYFYTFNIPLMTKINCIQFEIIPIKESNDCFQIKSINYIVKVRDMKIKDEKKWRKVVNYNRYDCIGLQELYFEEITTNCIRICILSGADPEFVIKSISYKYTRNPRMLFNSNIVRPVKDITAIEGTNCWLKIGSNQELITNYILRDDEDHDSSQYFLVPFLKMNLSSNMDFKTYYFIKFSQPFAIDSIQLDIKVENMKSLVKYKAVFEVSVLSNGSFASRYDSKDWVKVAEDLIEQSVTRNIMFDLRVVSAIKICGFRFKTDDQDLRIPLHVSRVRVPVNHSRVIHEMLSCFHNP